MTQIIFYKQCLLILKCQPIKPILFNTHNVLNGLMVKMTSILFFQGVTVRKGFALRKLVRRLGCRAVIRASIVSTFRHTEHTNSSWKS